MAWSFSVSCSINLEDYNYENIYEPKNYIMHICNIYLMHIILFHLLYYLLYIFDGQKGGGFPWEEQECIIARTGTKTYCY